MHGNVRQHGKGFKQGVYELSQTILPSKTREILI